jgi:hypothetical protein
VRADNGLSLGFVGKESVNLGYGTVEGADGEAVVRHVQDQVLSPERPLLGTHVLRYNSGRVHLHDSKANEAEISAFHMVSIVRSRLFCARRLPADLASQVRQASSVWSE